MRFAPGDLHARRRLLLSGALAAAAVLLVGCGTESETTEEPAASPLGRTVSVAPYVDVTSPDRPALTEVAAATGQDDFVLSFILAGEGGCVPSWGGTLPLDDPALLANVGALTSAGGEVVVASGGAAGPYLENVCGTAADLGRAYRTALDTVGANALDVDIEGEVPAEVVTEALAELQRERQTAITLTLQVQDESGLTPQAVEILRTAAEQDLDITVNAMVMNFDPEGAWGDSLVSTAQATVEQMREVWPDASRETLHRRLGLTLMIGRNDTGVITTASDVQTVLEYAQAHRVGFLGFWSLARDNGGCPGEESASSTCSGLDQRPYEFTEMFAARSQPGE
jgi:chitinase